ncbi:MAG: serine protein kinase RIO [Candidatus Aenigmarchaeota archaeon]|nr:serine protein kinase RIO [Candidatus Aenigmarchaeota archaeon]MBU5689349.1 serine protein kinase RIO [Candidatus Aenigmarchaeota archaeon]
MKKRLREDYKEFKIERGVFDNITLMTLYELMNKGYFNEVSSIVKEGKESAIFLGKGKENVAIKIYRTHAIDFKTMWQYLIGDPRFTKIRKNRHHIAYQWCLREYKNLVIASEAGVSCPKPIIAKNNVLVMQFVGDEKPAPRLIDVDASRKDYLFILDQIKILLKADLVHGDLSAYNILYYEKPVLIDFSQATTLKNSIALELLKRDIENINSYFKKIGVKVKDSQKIYEKFLKMVKK